MRGEPVMAAAEKFQIMAKVAATKKSIAYSADPSNLTNLPLKDAPEDFRSRAAIRKFVKGHERVNGNGEVTSGTGQTHAKQREGAVAKLIRTKKMSPVEMQAAEEIRIVYHWRTRKLWLRGYELRERTSASTGDQYPSWLDDAYSRRFKPWMDMLSIKAKRTGDKTISVVYDFLIEEKSARAIDENYGIQHGKGIRLLCNGLRDYAKLAGWHS